MSNDIKHKLDQIQRKRKWLSQQFDQQFIGSPVVEIAESGWYKQSDVNISFDESNQKFNANLTANKHAYLSYIEKNTSFSMPPTENNINLQTNREYEISIKGLKDALVNVELIVIYYSKGNKIGTKSIQLNKPLNLKLLPDTDQIRLALKITGSGSFTLSSIRIGDISIWNTVKENTNENFFMIESTKWYLPNNRKVSYDKNTSLLSINLNEKEHLYLPYNEANIKFNDLPQNPIKAVSDNLAIVFEGEKDSTLDVKLFLILYDEYEKKEIHQIDLNSKKYVQVPGDIINFRLAIRVSGQGNFSLSTIAVSGEGFWLPRKISEIAHLPKSDFLYDLDQSSLFGIGDDNNIIYYSNEKTYESKLIGKQYSYLPCMENIDVNEAPNHSLFSPKRKHYYEFFPKAVIKGNVELTLFVTGYRNGKRLEMHQVPFNQFTEVQFDELITEVKLFVRVNGSGFFKDIQLGMSEKEIEILNHLDLELTKSSWFQTSKVFSFSNEDNKLIVQANVPNEKKIYFSYKEQNNSFAQAPTIHLLPINSSSIYEFNVRAQVEDGVELLPMLIEYSGEKKSQVIQLKLNSPTTIQFTPDITDIRIAFRVGGQGMFKVEQFSITEMPILNTNRSLHWIDEREIDELKLVEARPLKKLKMAVIFDVFTTASYKEECELITFTPENWLDVLTNNKPDLLMVESAWQGNNGTWNKRVGYYGEENMKPLFNLLQWCKENNIPTVFWNKEDPVHYNRFIETAKKFEYIFTTDENMVPHYKEGAGHNQVYALPFAAQPIIHNPIKIVEERENKACFAGSYYRHHEERAQDMDRVLDYAAKYGLEIFDRNYEKNLKGLMPNHRFPERYDPFIKGSLKYYEIDKAYKGYKVMINVNTVKYSPTMFSRRVFEGLACGTPVVSTYAQGIEHIFGDLVYISENEEEIDQAFHSLLMNDDEYRRKSILGIRDVLSKHTYAQRLKYIAEIVGLHVAQELPKVTVLSVAKSKEEFDRVVEQFESQNYSNKELYVLIDTFEDYLDVYRNNNNKHIKTFIRSYMHNYRNILEWIDTPYVAYFSNSDYYGANYLLDLMLCTTFTESDFIGKNSYFELNKDQSIIEVNENSEYEFVTSLNPSRTIMKTDVFSKESLLDVLSKFNSNTDLSSYLKYGKSFYSNDKFNYLSNAYKDPELAKDIVEQIEI